MPVLPPAGFWCMQLLVEDGERPVALLQVVNAPSPEDRGRQYTCMTHTNTHANQWHRHISTPIDHPPKRIHHHQSPPHQQYYCIAVKTAALQHYIQLHNLNRSTCLYVMGVGMINVGYRRRIRSSIVPVGTITPVVIDRLAVTVLITAFLRQLPGFVPIHYTLYNNRGGGGTANAMCKRAHRYAQPYRQ